MTSQPPYADLERYVPEEAVYEGPIDEEFLRRLLRPRDAWDEWTDPDSSRGKVLAYYDAYDAAIATLRATWRGRVVLLSMTWRRRLARWLGRP